MNLYGNSTYVVFQCAFRACVVVCILKMEDSLDEMFLRKQSAEHLLNIGKIVQFSCPPASRFYMSALEQKLIEVPDLIKNKTNKMYCCYCGSIWNLETCRIRIQPRPQRNRHIMTLQRIDAKEPWKLNTRQKRKLRKFDQSTSKIVYRCLVCKKKTVFPSSKTCSSKSEESTSTPVSKIKLKKGDINAGLFIPSPCLSSNEKNNLDKSQILEQTSVSETSLKFESSGHWGHESFVASDISKELSSSMQSRSDSFKNQTPPSSKFTQENSSSSQKESANKRKRTLLAQILNQEKNKKKKTTLSSFLVSL